MQIKALRNFWAPRDRGYEKNELYDVTEEVGKLYVNRGLAEKVTKKKEEPKKQSNKKKSTN